MRTRQYFKFEKIDESKGAWVESGYLLMPNEVTEFERLMSDRVGFSFNQAFQRLTGRDANDGIRNVTLFLERFE